jgi:cytochrome c oxidase assembly factor CtaG
MESRIALSEFLSKAWDWDPSKIIGCAALVLIYGFWTRLSSLRSFVIFLSGVLLLFLALASPLDALGDDYLFSAHMLQHFILLMLVPPLLILGLPEAHSRKLLGVSWVKRTERFLSEPWRAWIIANSVLWIWHIPLLYDWAIENETIHIIEHLMFLVSSTIFWWPVLAPTRESRLPFNTEITYLISAALSNMALGIVLTFLAVPVYSPYLAPGDHWGILSILRSQFHLDPLADQKLGGILMWVLGTIVFLAVILVEFGRWYSEGEPEGVVEGGPKGGKYEFAKE